MIWRASPSHPDLMVSDAGMVRHIPTGREHGGTSGGKAGRGYRQFRYHDREGKKCRPYVHRLVCEAFHGPAPKGKPIVLHNGDDTSSNAAENVRWGSYSENMREFIKLNGPPKRGNAPDIATVHGYMSAGLSRAHIARICGCSPDTIRRVLRREVA